MQTEDNKLDKWELYLEEQIKVVQACQSNKGLKSCTYCEEIIDCKTRKEYIKAVYDSMNKGEGGGFEF